MRWRPGANRNVPGVPERVLAHAVSRDGVQLAAGRSGFHWVAANGHVHSLPWEQVGAADWDPEEEILRVSAVGEFGQPSPRWVFALDSGADRLLQAVRERVSASVVLTRGGSVLGQQFRVIGRRSPVAGHIAWFVEYAVGLDPADPEVAQAVAVLLATAKSDVGE